MPPRSPRPFNRGPQKKEEAHRINNRIVGLTNFRLVGDDIEPAVHTFEEALRIARDLEMDLVEIVPNADPPVCRVIDYKKFLYEQKY